MTIHYVSNYEDLKNLTPVAGDIVQVIDVAVFIGMSNKVTPDMFGSVQDFPEPTFWINKNFKYKPTFPKVKGRGGKFKKYTHY